jgi:hypothetical protein
LGWVKRPYVQLRVKEDSIKPEALIIGQTEGFKGAFKEWVYGEMGGQCVRYGWIGGYRERVRGE